MGSVTSISWAEVTHPQLQADIEQEQHLASLCQKATEVKEKAKALRHKIDNANTGLEGRWKTDCPKHEEIQRTYSEFSRQRDQLVRYQNEINTAQTVSKNATVEASQCYILTREQIAQLHRMSPKFAEHFLEIYDQGSTLHGRVLEHSQHLKAKKVEVATEINTITQHSLNKLAQLDHHARQGTDPTDMLTSATDRVARYVKKPAEISRSEPTHTGDPQESESKKEAAAAKSPESIMPPIKLPTGETDVRWDQISNDEELEANISKLLGKVATISTRIGEVNTDADRKHAELLNKWGDAPETAANIKKFWMDQQSILQEQSASLEELSGKIPQIQAQVAASKKCYSVINRRVYAAMQRVSPELGTLFEKQCLAGDAISARIAESSTVLMKDLLELTERITAIHNGPLSKVAELYYHAKNKTDPKVAPWFSWSTKRVVIVDKES